MTSKVVLCNSS